MVAASPVPLQHLEQQLELGVVGVYILLNELLKRPLAILHLLSADPPLAHPTIAAGHALCTQRPESLPDTLLKMGIRLAAISATRRKGKPPRLEPALLWSARIMLVAVH
jgi:hypothetical protein